MKVLQANAISDTDIFLGAQPTFTGNAAVGTNASLIKAYVYSNTTVASLPSAASFTGHRTVVTDADANSVVFMSPVVGSGSVVCPVFSNGTVWLVG